jgi:hypothetical protein
MPSFSFKHVWKTRSFKLAAALLLTAVVFVVIYAIQIRWTAATCPGSTVLTVGTRSAVCRCPFGSGWDESKVDTAASEGACQACTGEWTKQDPEGWCAQPCKAWEQYALILTPQPFKGPGRYMCVLKTCPLNQVVQIPEGTCTCAPGAVADGSGNCRTPIDCSRGAVLNSSGQCVCPAFQTTNADGWCAPPQCGFGTRPAADGTCVSVACADDEVQTPEGQCVCPLNQSKTPAGICRPNCLPGQVRTDDGLCATPLEQGEGG